MSLIGRMLNIVATSRVGNRIAEANYKSKIMQKLQKNVRDQRNEEDLIRADLQYTKDVAMSKYNGKTMSDYGYTEEQIQNFETRLKKHGIDTNAIADDFIKDMNAYNAGRAVATAIVATQVAKPYEDTSPSSFKTKKDVYDSIPSTKSSGVMSRASNPETFKNGVVNMARTMDASAQQISKLLKMDAELLEELYYDKPFLFDLYFEYSLYDEFGASHEDSGINKLIESYEYKYGVSL